MAEEPWLAKTHALLIKAAFGANEITAQEIWLCLRSSEVASQCSISPAICFKNFKNFPSEEGKGKA